MPTPPPSDEQLYAISRRLLAGLCEMTGIPFDATDTHIESGSWITTKIKSPSMHDHLVEIVFVGILSYSFRDGAPFIQSVLLPFSRGMRLSVGKETILVANYVADEWEEFSWRVDEYGEWECDEMPSQNAPSKPTDLGVTQTSPLPPRGEA